MMPHWGNLHIYRSKITYCAIVWKVIFTRICKTEVTNVTEVLWMTARGGMQ